LTIPNITEIPPPNLAGLIRAWVKLSSHHMKGSSDYRFEPCEGVIKLSIEIES